MIDKILGKDIGTYVKKHRLMMFYAILPAIITAMLAVVPVIITKSFIDEGIMKSGTSVQFTESAEPETYETQDKSAGSTESQVSAQEKMVKKYSSVVIRWLQILNIVDNPPPSMVMIILAAVAALAFLFQSITTYLSDLAAAAFSNRSIKDLRIDLHKKFMSLNQGFFDKNKAGLLISRSTADLSVMQNSISNITIGLVQYPLLILFFTVYLLIQNFRLTLIVFIAAPVILGLIHLFGRKVKKHSIRVQDATADVTSVYQETLLCLKIIQGFCTAENRSQKFREAADFLYKKTMHWNRWLRGMGPMMDATLFIILPAILIAGILVFKHTFGELIAMFLAFKGVYSPVKNLAKINNELRTLQGATERVFAIMKTEPEISDKPEALVIPRHRGSIEFKDVHFGYKQGSPILKDISFTVKRGEMVAFVGSTGAGKSTLIDLIPRFYDPEKGQILIDGIDIRNITLNSLRTQIGIVSQEVLLFHDTILNNISCVSPNMDMEAVKAAAIAAHAHDFIMEQPDQYETVVGDRGTLLSGGQKQRISIARAIIINPAILILDEVASALDAESEELIQKSIEGMKGKCTIFVIAHRLSTIRNADRIFVLEKGRIIESGSHRELMELNGRFRQLHDMQYQI